jgi:hypothetical protein
MPRTQATADDESKRERVLPRGETVVTMDYRPAPRNLITSRSSLNMSYLHRRDEVCNKTA